MADDNDTIKAARKKLQLELQERIATRLTQIIDRLDLNKAQLERELGYSGSGFLSQKKKAPSVYKLYDLRQKYDIPIDILISPDEFDEEDLIAEINMQKIRRNKDNGHQKTILYSVIDKLANG